MKILHLTKHLNIGGITSYLLTLSKGLRKRGHEIIIISSGGELEKEFQKLGVVCIKQDWITKSELSPKMWMSIGSVKAFVETEKVDVIHAHTRVTQVLATIVSKMTGVPYVSTCHGFFKRRLGRCLLSGWGTRTIAVSPIIETHLVRDLKISKDKITVISNSVDVDEIRMRYKKHDSRAVKHELGIAEDEPVLGIISRVVEVKGYRVLLEAIEKLHTEFPKLKVIIGGDGPFRKTLESLVQKANLQQFFIFYGMTQDVTKPLSAIDIFVLPVLWEEGFGLAIPEAMACGKAVIVSDKGALNWLVTAEKSGLIVKVGDSDSLAQAIRRLLTNPDLRQRLSDQARMEANERFSLDRMAQETEKFYLSVVKQ